MTHVGSGSSVCPFDDGYLDNLETVAPMLRELDVPATFFVTAEPRDRASLFWWDVLEEMLLCGDACPNEIDIRVGRERRSFSSADLAARRKAHDDLYRVFKASSPVVRDDLLAQLAGQVRVSLTRESDRPMVSGEVRRLKDFPRIEVGAHSLHHLSLPELTPEDCYREVFECRSAVERLTGNAVTSFAYPFGALSPDVVTMVMAAGSRRRSPARIEGSGHGSRLSGFLACRLERSRATSWQHGSRGCSPFFRRPGRGRNSPNSRGRRHVTTSGQVPPNPRSAVGMDFGPTC